jgi:hypothetical protein
MATRHARTGDPFHRFGWNENCSQRIPQHFEAADVAAVLAERDKRIEMLEAELRGRR